MAYLGSVSWLLAEAAGSGRLTGALHPLPPRGLADTLWLGTKDNSFWVYNHTARNSILKVISATEYQLKGPHSMLILSDLLQPLQSLFPSTDNGRERSAWFAPSTLKKTDPPVLGITNPLSARPVRGWRWVVGVDVAIGAMDAASR